MATIATPPLSSANTIQAHQAEVVGPRAKPIKYWASFGAFVIALQLYVYIRWLSSSSFKRTPTGADAVPGWMKAEITATEVLSLVGLVVALYFFFVRPWRRERRVTADGLISLGFLTLYWQDLMLNYTSPLATYNSFFFNRGSWFSFVPGWASAHGSQTAEPMLMAGPFYVYGCFGASVLGCVVMRKAHERWPQIGKLGLMAIAYLFFCVFDFILEPLVILRLGWWAYPGAIRSMSVFAGTQYQFPLYGMVLMAGVWTAWASLRFFKDDQGRTVVERGVDRLNVGGKSKTFVRFLAIAGCLNLMWLIYMVPIQFFDLHNDAWPNVFAKRSYLTDGLCKTSPTSICGATTVVVPSRSAGS
jgi:hypothetical protein